MEFAASYGVGSQIQVLRSNGELRNFEGCFGRIVGATPTEWLLAIRSPGGNRYKVVVRKTARGGFRQISLLEIIAMEAARA